MNDETDPKKDVKNATELIDGILMGSRSPREVLQKLYLVFQRSHRNPSLENFARALDIPSKGYLSNLLSGKTKLGEKHISGISRYYSLNEHQEELLLLMSKIERKKKEMIEINLPSEIRRAKKRVNTRNLKKSESPLDCGHETGVNLRIKLRQVG